MTAWPFKMGDMGCPETSVTTDLRCVTSHKDEELITIVVEAWNHAILPILAYNIIAFYVKKFPSDQQEQNRLGFNPLALEMDI